MRGIRLVITGWVALFCCATSYAQVTLSPFTLYGIGDIKEGSFANQFAMGDLGIGTPTVFHINGMNPAMLTQNLMSTFQMGVAADIRTLSSSNGSDRNGGANLAYFAYAFPIVSGKWSSSFGLVPLSRMNYNIGYTANVNNSTTQVDYLFKGNGGLSKAYFSNGFKIYKGLSLGVRGSFVFGEFNKSAETFLLGLTSGTNYTTAYKEKINYADFEFGGGLHYQQKLTERTAVNLGVVYDLPSSISGTRFAGLERRSTGGSTPGDTLILDQSVAFNLPKKLGFGVSFENLNKFTVGFDARISEWNENPSPEIVSTTYQKGLKLVLGGEYTPDISSVDSYLARTTFRLGAAWERLPYLANGNDVTDFGINFGSSFPMGVSSFDVAAKIGRRGSVTDNLIKENYIQIYIGATINDRGWFVRRKYD
ncbi:MULTISPECIES: hypothetical protein [unclassified Imperialibacter]|uniref:hypothetical protein n=1 Tax=unclassified Imperialibacter TaxID=2629706 RepID=UPI001250E210|nr:MULTISPECIES: hypothetical protein [unclassified Imperialibacter]CAD5271787.1 conserved exported hypothetical protein [Imperialibacter sp. 89]CAD5299038.1 conserved exported hypothetical protein [Imperialibacter sp. 75]VVT35128.1 conserved exported hypothetical protein [Imperialibacter sp. EC-SDR9]